VWEKKPLFQRQKAFHFDRPRRYYSATIDALPFREAADRLATANRWPFEIEVVATLECARCRPGNRVARHVRVMPGD
jgi:hypothetical protein